MNNTLQRWCIIFTLLVMYSSGAWAQLTYTSIAGGDWNTGSTWDQGSAPGASDNVIIAAGHTVTLAAPVTIGGTATVAGTLQVNTGGSVALSGGTLTIQNGGTYQHNINSGTIPAAVWNTGSTCLVTGSAAAAPNGTNQNFYHFVWNCPSQSTNLGLSWSGNTIGGNVTVLNTGGAANQLRFASASASMSIAGNVTVNGATAFLTTTGTSSLAITINIGGNLVVSAGSFSLSNSSSSTALVNVTGNVTVASGATLAKSNSGNGSKLVFKGTGAHTLSHAGINGSGLNFEIADGGTVTLGAPLAVNGILTLTNGIINSSATNTLIVTTLSGGGASSYVNGPLTLKSAASVTLQALTFHIGSGASYVPVVLNVTQTAGTTTSFTATALASAPPANALAGTTDKVSHTRCFTVAGSNVASATVQFPYSAADAVTDNASLRIVQGPAAGGGTWLDIGGTGSLPTTGTITSNVITDLSTNTAFTFANASGGTNALPVELTGLTGSMNGRSVLLKWKTATEVNNRGFDVERKPASSSVWETIGFVAGAGTTNSAREYLYADRAMAPAVYAYRLKQIDNDGAFTYSAETRVDAGTAAADFQLLKNYPNPFNPSTTIAFSVPADGMATLKVYNLLGQEVATIFSGMAKAGHFIPAVFNAGGLASGVYVTRLDYNGTSLMQKMLLTK
jgi:hypothetical protein